MKESRYFYVPDAAQQNELPSDEATHATRVLRLKEGDELFLMDGEGSYFKARITVAASHHCYYEILEQLPQQPQWEGHLHLAIAPTKMIERMEWLIEKATEVGVDELSFLNCAFSERKIVKLPRLDKIAVSAVKQSHKAWKPVLNEMETFKAEKDVEMENIRIETQVNNAVNEIHFITDLISGFWKILFKRKDKKQ